MIVSQSAQSIEETISRKVYWIMPIRKSMILASICLVLLGLGVTSCGKKNDQVANPAIGVDAKTAVTNALLALATRSYSMDVSTELTDGGTRRSIVEFIPPDKKRIMDMSSGMEYIIIGKDVYAKTSSIGNWSISQTPASTFMPEDQATAQNIGDNLKDVVVLRSDTLDGKAVIVYRYNSSSSSNGIDLHSLTDLWVADADGLPHKILINGEILSSSIDTTTGKNKLSAVQSRTTTLITFDPPITIVAPVQ
jgi:hypothetical protein